jgi:hypothetical protein
VSVIPVRLNVAPRGISIKRIRTPRAGFSVSCELVAISTTFLRGATRNVTLIATVQERLVRLVPPRANNLTSEAKRGHAAASLASFASPAGASATKQTPASATLPPNGMRRLRGTSPDHTTPLIRRLHLDT